MKRLALSLIALALLAVSVSAYYGYSRPDEQTQFSLQSVTRGDIVESVSATGTLQPVRTVMVGSQVSGNIKALHADFNSIVREGQVVAELDPSLFQTQVEQAKASLVRAETERDRQKVALDDARMKLERTRALFQRAIATQQDLETAQVTVRSAEASLRSSDASVLQARASLKQAEVSLEQTIIRAPADGIVTSRNVDVGQTVAARLNAPTIFVIAGDLTQMQVVASVDESEVGRIVPGQAVRFRVDAHPEEEFIGTVAQVRLNPNVVQNVVTYATVIDVPNPDLKLASGMTANLTIDIARRANVLRVPAAALRYSPSPDIFAELHQAVPPELQRRATPSAAENGTTVEQPRAATAAGGTNGGPIASSGTASTAMTVDRLFATRPPVQSRGRVWMQAGGQVKAMSVRLGISDGTWCELLGSDLAEGQALVTRIVTPAMAAAAAKQPAGQLGRGGGEQNRSSNPFQGGGGGHGPH